MDSNVQPSFIPKKPLTQTPSQPRAHVSFFTLIATVFFITAIILSGAVFGYARYVNTTLSKKQDTLKSQLAKFDPALVADLSRLDARFLTASDLMQKHLSVSSVFTALGNATLKNVRFASFNYTANNNQRPTIIMDGEAQTFADVALQVAEFQKSQNSKYIKNAIISNPNLDTKGNVTFSFTGTVDPTYLTYALVQKAQGVTVSATSVPDTARTTVVASTTSTVATSTATTTKTTTTKPKTTTR